jgi:hypothetical protein
VFFSSRIETNKAKKPLKLVVSIQPLYEHSGLHLDKLDAALDHRNNQ